MSARSTITFVGGLCAQNRFFKIIQIFQFLFIDPTESTDSLDIIDSIDSILVPHKETANIHTTHKGEQNTDGGGAEGAAPIGTFVRARSARPFVWWCECWRCVV